MILKVKIVLLGLILFVNTAANGQENTSLSFPYHLSSYREAGLMAGGTALLYAGALTQRILKPMTADELSQLSASSLPFFDRYATKQWDPQLNNIREFLEPTSILLSAGLIGGMGLKYKLNDYSWSPLMTLTMMYFEGAYLTEGMVLLTKSLVKRPRPYTYNDQLTLDYRARSANNESFISGNAAILFFNATFASQVVSDLYPDSSWTKWVWISTHSIAAISGFWSVKSGMHFPTDILAGAAWGSGMALYTLVKHKSKNKSKSKMKTNGRLNVKAKNKINLDQLSIVPIGSNKFKGLSLSYTF